MAAAEGPAMGYSAQAGALCRSPDKARLPYSQQLSRLLQMRLLQQTDVACQESTYEKGAFTFIFRPFPTCVVEARFDGPDLELIALHSLAAIRISLPGLLPISVSRSVSNRPRN